MTNHHFCIVEQCIETLIGSIFCGDGAHQFRIDDCQYGIEFGTAETDFLVGGVVGDDAPAVDFRPCARSCGNCHDRQSRLLQRQTFARASVNVVPQIAWIGCHCSYGYRRIENGSAAQCHDEVASVFTGYGGSLHDDLLRRIFVNVSTEHIGDMRFAELFDSTVKRSGRPDRFTVRDE